jgi:hypothetical protein
LRSAIIIECYVTYLALVGYLALLRVERFEYCPSSKSTT